MEKDRLELKPVTALRSSASGFYKMEKDRLELKPVTALRSSASGIRHATSSGTEHDEDSEISSKVKKMKPHVPGIVTFADHNRKLPWTVTYHAVVMFADISGFTALCEKYSGMGQSGVDQLTRTLNEYLGALVEGILGSDGDILKFAGDAILAIWRVGRVEELQAELAKVVGCCLDMQDRCGEWDTDIGVKLTVKIGVSAGEMSVTFLGNNEYRHYVELGPAVTAVNAAEAFCQSGDIVMSPEAWDLYAQQDRYDVQFLEDHRHVKIVGLKPENRVRSHSLPTPCLIEAQQQQPASGRKIFVSLTERELDPIASAMTVEVTSSKPEGTYAEDKPKQMKGMVQGKMKLGSKFGKLRKVVETVTEMRLDLALRLYILLPVLKKLDDDQPLEYLSEMRQVSIVFMNLVLDDKKDSTSLLQKIFELVYTQTKSMHGCLNKVFLFDKGCTFLIIFGLPGYKHEQDCAHAILSSGRMKARLNTIPGVIRVSIGVTTGTTFCGVVGHTSRHEYSVIGRKVNMAARLMMHYPNKVSCDNETFQNCRLPKSNFEVLVTKQMKGLTNVGIIREFLEQSKEDTMTPKSIAHSDYPLLGRQVEEFLFREQLTKMKTSGTRKHLVFSGAAGIGKTKLLDQIVDIAEDKNVKVIQCCIELHGSSIPYFIAGHILRTLLKNCGLESESELDEHITEQLSEDSSQYLYLLNDVICLNCEKPANLSEKTVDEKAKRRELLRAVTQTCLLPGSETVIIIDDAHNIDTASWEFMVELCPIRQILIVLGIRPSIIEKPSCKEAIQFIEEPEVKLIDLGGLDLKFMAPLACQMMNVVALPRDLDKLLRERSHGVPAWCMEMLRDILDKKQLIVVHDDGRPEHRQSALIPNRLLVKPVCSSKFLRRASHSTLLKISVTDLTDTKQSDESAMLESLGYSHEAPLQKNKRRASLAITTTATRRGLHVPAFQDNAINAENLETAEPDRIAMFANGITAFDIPVPRSMKELIIARLDSMRASDQLLVKCAAVLGMNVRKDILEMLLPKAHRPKMSRYIRRLMESGIFMCGKTPTSHGAQLVVAREDVSSSKYKCYCPRDSMISRIGELQVCSALKFTNSLLQQTAYECLLEAQRVELHAKAARYFEISADEFRENIPYHILARPPPDYLQEALENQQAFDPFAHHKRPRRSQVEDELIKEHAEWSRAKRGRRQAVVITVEEASPLINRIVDQAMPLLHVHLHVEELIPIYDSLLYHWKAAGKPRNVLTTLLEATAAAIAVKKNAKAFELIGEARTLMMEDTTIAENEEELIVFQAKVYRLHGKILFQAGYLHEAYEHLLQAGQLLCLKHPSRGASMRVFTARLLARFFFYWKFHIVRNPPASFRVLEQGYCLTDMYKMDIERRDKQLKLVHALQQFTKIAGRKIHLHQIITAYSSMIECCRERSWFDISDKLEEELLRGCAARHGELSTEDRSTLGGIFARSCFTFFVRGDLVNAEKAGRDAAEICVCIQDLHLTKFITPYYSHLCLMRNAYDSCVDLLNQYKFAAQMTDDGIARAIYYTLCLEVALAGGCPPETPQSCLACIASYLRTCDAVKTEIMIRFYVAMTVALWCARKERWEEIQTWFDYWEMYQAEDDFSFFSLLGRANKIEGMLLSVSKCSEIGNTGVAKMLKTQIGRDLHWLSDYIDINPVLQPRLEHLKAYFAILDQHTRKSRLKIGKAIKCASDQGNVHEVQWMMRNREMWRKGKFDTKCNEVWQEHTGSHHLEWQLKSGLSVGMNMYTLPLPQH